MERDLEGENKYKKHKLVVTNPDWLDLPEPIVTNIILEHLDVVDYVRFSAVCKKWHLLQKEHRTRYSPYPPPSPLPFPWLSCCRCSRDYNKDGRTIVFHLLDKQKTYKISLSKTYKIHDAFQLRHGCLLVLLGQSFCIVNPITGVQIELPPLSIPLSACYSSLISSPPTDPDCTILIIGFNGKAYLYRLHDSSGWKTIEYSEGYEGKTIIHHNKIYRLRHCERFCMVDTLLLNPIEQMIEMDCSEICVAPHFRMFDLVSFFGKLLMIIIVLNELPRDDYDIIKEFQVYRAEFSMNKWVRMESLGEYVLFFSWGSTFSLPAVDLGCKKNTVYYAEGFMPHGAAWRIFDLSIKNWIDGPSISLPCYLPWHGDCSWFLPTLDYFGVDKRACHFQLG